MPRVGACIVLAACLGNRLKLGFSFQRNYASAPGVGGPCCVLFLPMTLLKGSSSRDARAQTWPDINQEVRFAAMANESYSDRNRNRLFEIVRDGSYAEAKKVLSEADMTWRHTALRQNFLFFIAARRRRGSEVLAKQCVGMGVNLEEVDVYGQTPLFWAAARGNMVVAHFLLQLGFRSQLP